jgi:hypothetical protein
MGRCDLYTRGYFFSYFVTTSNIHPWKGNDSPLLVCRVVSDLLLVCLISYLELRYHQGSIDAYGRRLQGLGWEVMLVTNIRSQQKWFQTTAVEIKDRESKIGPEIKSAAHSHFVTPIQGSIIKRHNALSTCLFQRFRRYAPDISFATVSLGMNLFS